MDLFVEEVCHQVKELWEEGGTQDSIRDDEKQIGWIQTRTRSLQKQEPELLAAHRNSQALCSSG